MSANLVKILHPRTMGELVTLLQDHHIPMEQYGMGRILPLQALLDQIENGKVILKEQGGKLIRLMNLVAVSVYYKDHKQIYKLEEDRQVMVDPSTKEELSNRKNRRKKPWSIGNKILVDDDTRKKAVSSLEKQLGLQIPPDRLMNETYWVYSHMSTKYAKFRNHARVFEYDLFLTPSEYNPEGYVFQDKYLRNYFHWKKLAS